MGKQSPKGRFAATYAAVLCLLAIFDGTRAWSGPRARKGLMSGPPGLGGAMGGGLPTQMTGQLSSSQPGTVSNTSSVPQRHQVATIPNVPGGTYYMYSQLETLGSLAAYLPAGLWDVSLHGAHLGRSWPGSDQDHLRNAEHGLLRCQRLDSGRPGRCLWLQQV